MDLSRLLNSVEAHFQSIYVNFTFEGRIKLQMQWANCIRVIDGKLHVGNVIRYNFIDYSGTFMMKSFVRSYFQCIRIWFVHFCPSDGWINFTTDSEIAHGIHAKPRNVCPSISKRRRSGWQILYLLFVKCDKYGKQGYERYRVISCLINI